MQRTKMTIVTLKATQRFSLLKTIKTDLPFYTDSVSWYKENTANLIIPHPVNIVIFNL